MTSRSNIAIAVALALASAAAHAAPRSLDAAALDAVAAGAAGDPAAVANGSSSTIVADRSELELHTDEQVVLRDAAQRQAAAANVVNASGADVVSTANIATALGGRVLGRQLNRIFQVENSYGSVERIALTGPVVSRSHSTASAFSSSTSSSSMLTTRLQSRSSHSVRETYAAGVPAYYPLQDLTITLGTPDIPAVTVPSFNFNLTHSDDTGTYGIRGSLGPFTFDPPQIVLGTVSFQGDDLVVAGGYVDLPSLDLGSATIESCFIKCGGVSVSLPTVDGPRIDLPGEWRFEDANPFKDVRINAGNGIAAAGSGHVNMSAAHVTLTADLSLDLPDLTTSFSFDVLGQSVNTGEFGVEIPPISASLTLVDADFGPGYRADFDGALCLTVRDSNDCGRLDHSQSSQSSFVDVRQTTASASGSTSEASSSAGAEILTAAASLDGAEAELIAMSEGRARIEQDSAVELGLQAQRGLQAVNAVNASGAIIGNALNVGTPRAASTPAAGISQTNSFTQFKTRPRSP